MAGIVPFRAPVDLAPLKAFREFAAFLAHGHQFTAEARVVLIGAHEFRFKFFGFGTEGHKFINTGRYCMGQQVVPRKPRPLPTRAILALLEGKAAR